MVTQLVNVAMQLPKQLQYVAKPTIYGQEPNESIFSLYMPCTIQNPQALDNRLPGLLVRTDSFFRCC